jgi:lipoyl(octanoyl) transferase
LKKNILYYQDLGQTPYLHAWHEMQNFTLHRDQSSLDQVWFLEHPPVFTQGQNGKPEHILSAGDIPIVAVDRGGQVTYHGPGQVVAYLLIDLRRKELGIRSLVSGIENAVIQLLAEQNIIAQARAEAPGVYVDNKKIASLGLRVKRGCTYHGLALNVNMNLEPFSRINPCGLLNMKMTQIADYVPDVSIEQVKERLLHYFCYYLGYDTSLSLDTI